MATSTPPPPTPTLSPTDPTPRYSYRIIHTYPHDPEAFTQGLVYENGVLYEGTGLRGRSSLRLVTLETGAVQQMILLEDRFFGEGIAIWQDRIFQLTWQSRVGFIYDKETFTRVGEFEYVTEGWGLTHDGRSLIMSDGSATLYFLDPDTLTVTGQITVFDERGPVVRLNELEYIEGEVWANVWQTELIARIDPQSGRVTGWVDLTGLLDQSNLSQPVDVLNGIAYDAENGRLFVTGKLWPTLFEIEVFPISDTP
ncbi:MAG: glutaminyl-peptide cyclotransferase [Chloroflexi bacterium]|nr:MAG: glutaminyl-peptide cyclotransferase [Chloroflexota bacterium]